MSEANTLARVLFEQLLELSSAEERASVLNRQCGDDESLRKEVESLFAAHQQAGSFLEHPAVNDLTTKSLLSTQATAAATDSQSMLASENGLLDFLDPSEEPDSMGRLGKHEIQEVIGRGGMGIVLKAHDTRLNRIAAVKVLAPQLASNVTARKRFEKEAQAAAAISHDHVVAIFEVDNNVEESSQRLPYLVMEFIDGQSLHQRIEGRGPLELKEILRISQQVAAGLSAAHLQGLIHRDVKPGNILLQNGIQRVKITDFGLARAVDDIGITRTGEVTGTPQYMSPEQAQGQTVDPRTDLFSLGSVMYAMCTGRSPFRADTSVATLRRVCDDTQRPIREINPDIPIWLVEIIDCLLEKNPDDRFQSAAEVSEVLGRCLARLQQVGPTSMPDLVLPQKRQPPRVRTSKQRGKWAVAAMMLLAVGTMFSVAEATGVTELASTVIRVVTGEGTLVVEVDDPSVEVSIDGEELSISGAGLKEIRLRPGQYQFQATKDGEPIEQKIVSITRGDREVVRVSRGRNPNSTSDVSKARATTADYRCIPEGVITLEKVLHRPLDVHGEWSPVREISFFPSGKQLACSSLFLELWDIETEQVELLDHTNKMVAGDAETHVAGTPSMALSANGELIAAANTDGMIRIWDVKRREVMQTINPRLKATEIRIINHVKGLAFSHAGDYLIACNDFSNNARLLEVDSGEERWTVEGPHPTWAEFTADDQFVMLGDGSSKLRFIRVATGAERFVETGTRSMVLSAALSPDNKIAVAGTVIGMIAVVDVETGSVIHRTSAHPQEVTSIAFLPDGHHFLSGSRDKTMRLWDAETGLEVARIEGANHFTNQVAVSPDGRFVASGGGEFVSFEKKYYVDGDHGIRIWKLPKSAWPKHSRDGEKSRTTSD